MLKWFKTGQKCHAMAQQQHTTFHGHCDCQFSENDNMSLFLLFKPYNLNLGLNKSYQESAPMSKWVWGKTCR